ncbi:MAG: Protein-L-isoaspartate O-methyltransferase [Actinobacteria bacterium ADurb.Bin346]|nr:MAG: Protein-L-isoaspartate O-methyltransferase [Actinobacteria bacterium ADurb.Bin346]
MQLKDVMALRRNDMVDNQLEARGIKDERVLDAMRSIPREAFVDPAMAESAYDDRPLSIGFSQTISQPYIVALMTELLELKGNEKVLEIGTGSGYQTAVLSKLAAEVYSIEIVKPLYDRTSKLLAPYKNVTVANRDGYNGWKEHAPYDRIIVTAAPENVPEPLIEQLKAGGIMVIPSGPHGWSQSLIKIVKKPDGTISKDFICDVAFVPLTRKDI